MWYRTPVSKTVSMSGDRRPRRPCAPKAPSATPRKAATAPSSTNVRSTTNHCTPRLVYQSMMRVPDLALVQWDMLRQDVRYGLRVLRRAPGFAMTSILIVALGIGATTAAFSVTDFVLIRPLPFPEAHRLVKLWERRPGFTRLELSPANYRDWKRSAHSF